MKKEWQWARIETNVEAFGCEGVWGKGKDGLQKMMIGASLSEPHINDSAVRELYIDEVFSTSVTRCATPYSLYSHWYGVDKF